MILEQPEVTPAELQARTGWELRPEGLCKADRCVPLPAAGGERLDLRTLSQRLGMALENDEQHGLWALGPESGAHALQSAELPPITLPDRHGTPFSLESLRGMKMLIVTWASW